MVGQQGDTLHSGKYIIQKKLKDGGFGITYKALHLKFNGYVVIKTPNQDLQNDPEYPKFVKRFRQEGQTLFNLRHPHIVRVTDLFDEGTLPCLVMEFVQGDSLFDVVRKRGALSEHDALIYIRQIGAALITVHAQGLVHRDVHPGNIMLPDSGNAILIDFGIVGEMSPTNVSSQYYGNPHFAPPEQFLGIKAPTIDIYTLAGSLYYALTGSLPRIDISNNLIPPKKLNNTISDRVNNTIVRAREHNPTKRHQTMDEWLDYLPETGSNQKVIVPPKTRSVRSYNQRTPRVVIPQHQHEKLLRDFILPFLKDIFLYILEKGKKIIYPTILFLYNLIIPSIRFTLNHHELIIIFVSIITGFICATEQGAVWLLLWALWALPGAVVGTMEGYDQQYSLLFAMELAVGGAVGGAVLFAVIGAVAGYQQDGVGGAVLFAVIGVVFGAVLFAVVTAVGAAVGGAVGAAVNKIEKSFTTFQAWLILLASCLIGFGVGGFVRLFFR